MAPVQLALRLLITARSKLLDLPEIRELVGPYDEEGLVYPWRHPDPKVDELQRALQRRVEEATKQGRSRPEIFHEICNLAGLEGARRAEVSNAGYDRRVTVPYLTEPWYC